VPKDAYDATPSWSGYTYQGKLALLHSLKVIIKLIDNDLSTELKDHAVEIEWEEDFAIKKGKTYLSLHQVKAHKTSSPSKYKKALKYLLAKTKDHADALFYLHVWREIKYTDKITDFESMKTTFNNAGCDAQTLLSVKLYDYDGIKYCDLDKVDQYIYKELESYYDNPKAGSNKATSQQIDQALITLYGLIDKHVMFRHKNQGSRKQAKEIPFSEIINVINRNYEEPSDDYIYLKTKLFILNMASQFCDNTMLCKRTDCEDICGLKSMVVEIESMDPHDLFSFLANRSPDEFVNNSGLGLDDYQAVCDSVGVKNTLLKAIYELPLENYSNGLYINSDRISYLPTTLHESDNAAEIAKNILTNPSIFSIMSLFNFDKFISKDVLINDLEAMASGIRSWDPDVIKNLIENHGDKINKIKKVQVLPLEAAKHEVI
jgi:hypothetical protein